MVGGEGLPWGGVAEGVAVLLGDTSRCFGRVLEGPWRFLGERRAPPPQPLTVPLGGSGVTPEAY